MRYYQKNQNLKFKKEKGMWKNQIKNLLYRMGIYDNVRKGIIKLYYPYKNYKIRKNAQAILEKVRRVFEEQAEEYWLDYGTLLGYVREGKIIKGDLDLDFGVILSDKTKSLKDYLKREEVYITQMTTVEGEITAEQYRYKDIGFDIFYYRKVEETYVTNIWLADSYVIPQRESYAQNKGKLYETTFSSFATKEIKFYNVPFKVPGDYNRYLGEHFGKDYMVPNPNFTHDDEMNKVPVKKDFEVIFYE